MRTDWDWVSPQRVETSQPSNIGLSVFNSVQLPLSFFQLTPIVISPQCEFLMLASEIPLCYCIYRCIQYRNKHFYSLPTHILWHFLNFNFFLISLFSSIHGVEITYMWKMNLAVTWIFNHSVLWLGKNVHSSHQLLAHYYLKNPSQVRMWLFNTASSLSGIFANLSLHYEINWVFILVRRYNYFKKPSQLSGGKNTHFKDVSEKNWKKKPRQALCVLSWSHLKWAN